MQNYYSTLGLEELASEEEIKKAFKRMAIAFHPDKNPDNPLAEEEFKKINEAYQILSDPTAKARYDYLLQFAYSYKYYAQHRPTEAPQNYQRYHTPKEKEPKNFNLYATLFSFAVIGYMFMVVSSWYSFTSRYFYYQALQEIKAQNFEEAISSLNVSLGYDYTFAPAYFMRARLYHDFYRYPAGALKDYTKTIETSLVHQSDYFLERGIAYGQVNEKTEALIDFDKALYLADYEPTTANEVANEYFSQLKTFDLAIDVYDVLIEQDSLNPKHYERRGIAYLMLKDPIQAQENFDTSVKVSSSPLSQRLSIIEQLREDIRNYPLAIRNISILIEQNPKEADYYSLRAITFLQDEKPEAALRDLSVAIAYRGNKAEYYSLRAKVLLDMGRAPEACIDWRISKKLGNTENHQTLNYFCSDDESVNID